MRCVALALRGQVRQAWPMFDDLDKVLADAFCRIGRGARQRRSPLHTPVVGTDGGDMRVMVLRSFDQPGATLRFHTDARAPKVAKIGAGGAAPRPVGVLFYDPVAKLQLRTRGLGRIERATPAADEAWAASTNFARRCYLAQSPPGALAATPASGLPREVEGIEPSEAQLAAARPNFALLLVEITALDWLYLAHDGHRRALFGRDAAGRWEGRWAIP